MREVPLGVDGTTKTCVVGIAPAPPTAEILIPPMGKNRRPLGRKSMLSWNRVTVV